MFLIHPNSCVPTLISEKSLATSPSSSDHLIVGFLLRDFDGAAAKEKRTKLARSKGVGERKRKSYGRDQPDAKGYDILLSPVDADEVGDVVSLLQTFPQQRAIGHVIREVHRGKRRTDFVRQNGHLQAAGCLFQNPGLQLLRRTKARIRVKPEKPSRREVRRRVGRHLTCPTLQSKSGAGASSAPPSIAPLNDSSNLAWSRSHLRTLAFITWQQSQGT